MSEFENKMDSSSGGAGQDNTEIQSLRTLIVAALVMVVCLNLCVIYFISGQATEMKRQVAMDQQVLERYQGFSTKAAEFWGKLMDFSKTHPDFAPIMDKYKGNLSVHTNGVPPAVKQK
jgi:hypothetical protein